MVSASLRLYSILLVIISAEITCKAVPSPTVNIPLGEREGDIKGITGTSHVANLTRQHEGDMFIANGLSSCNIDTCVGLSSGTAGLPSIDTKETVTPSKETNSMLSGSCECRCLPYLNTYREDVGICVDDIHECTLSPFISGSSSEKIPFVFLPLRGQIIYPSREISFPDVRTPICAVTSSQYLTSTGWSDLRNPIDTDFPFRLFRDEGRTFLQWLGEPDLRYRMQGRLILVHLMCRDMALPSLLNKTNSKVKTSGKIFTPCVAFRVSGSPVQYINNVSEVLFQAEATSNLSPTTEGLTTREYIVIGICSLLLGLIYVASVFLYLHVKKRKLHSSEAISSTTERNNDYPKNDQVTFGTPFSRAGSLYSAASIVDLRNSQRSRQSSISREDIGIVKNNPLLKHFPNLSDHSGFAGDLSNSNSECEEPYHSGSVDRSKNSQTLVVIHPSNGYKTDMNRISPMESHSPTQENERIPEANVSIVEDMCNDDKLENMRAIVNGTVRKKLYFNPAYFEPHLLLSPPPAAIEFLTKIREVIAIAKYKMGSKRYQPSLNVIPEEGNLHDFQIYNNSKSSLTKHSEKTARLECSGCPGCSNHTCNNVSKCNNCGEKRNSIEKWLESVPIHDEDNSSNNKDSESNTKLKKEEHFTPTENNSIIKNYLGSSNMKSMSATTPKIISHSLKTTNQSNATSNAFEVKSNQRPISPVEAKGRFKENGIYTFAETGSEIYNNPKFNHLDSPALSQRSITSSLYRNKPTRKRVEVLDQYANPKIEKNRYEILKSIKHMPDMVYEAMAKDYSIGNFSANKSLNQTFNIPTPDYDGSIDKKMKDIYNSTQSSDPSVPTPDYSTLGRKALRQCQPDSPVYRRRSPQYLIVDYETDSLERTTPHRKINGALQSSSSASSDGSSQPSPSLSTALPLEEEVEIHHTVYDKVEGHRKDGDVVVKQRVAMSGDYEDIKFGSKQNIVTTPRIKYDTPFQGSMTIEVEHEPQSDLELSTDSDQFEPDTLDRKPKKHSFCDIKPMNAWTEHLSRSNYFVNANDSKVSYSSLENMNSLPEISQNQHVVVRTSNSFRSNYKSYDCVSHTNKDADYTTNFTSFGSLREIYQSKNSKQIDRPKLTNLDFDEQGKLLTLEAKHTKRQRKNIDDITRKLMPPDVIPPENNFYDIPKYPVKIDEIDRKNLPGWNNDDFSGNNSRESKGSTEDTETTSSTSQSTEITGVSDTHRSSDFENETTTKNEHHNNYVKEPKSFGSCSNDYSAIQAKFFQNETNENNKKFRIYQEIGPKFKSSSENGERNKDRTLKRSFSSQFTGVDDPDKIEVLSTRSLSNRSFRIQEESRERLNSAESSRNTNRTKMRNLQAVYRVEIPSPTSGMQIAMGLKDRAKKSKDLKNAWKKFVSMAASKFNANTGGSSKHFETFEKKTQFADIFDRDEGISSLIDYTSNVVEPSCKRNNLSRGSAVMGTETPDRRFNVRRSQPTYYDQRYGRNELDSGYMSADSSEVYNRRVYERYNFKSMTEKDHIIRIDTIEDNSDCVDNASDENSERCF